MKKLVTGGTVFASRAVAAYFAQRGDQVYTLNRGRRPQPDGVTHICADRHALGEKLKQSCFDAILDITAYTGEDVTALLDAVGGCEMYVLLSSSAVYPETLPQPFRESDRTGANAHWGDYGLGKIAAETTLLRRFPDAYIIRPPYLCGAGNNLFREGFVFACAENGLPFYVPDEGDLPLQFFDIDDLCRLIEAILDRKPAQHILNCGNPETVTAREWVQICYDIAQADCTLYGLPEDIPVRAYFPFRRYAYRLDVTAQQSLLPQTTPLRASLESSFAWWKKHSSAVQHKPFLEYLAEHADVIQSKRIPL